MIEVMIADWIISKDVQAFKEDESVKFAAEFRKKVFPSSFWLSNDIQRCQLIIWEKQVRVF